MIEPSPQLVARCRQGDPQAFAELIAQQQPYVYNLAFRLLQSPDEAQDLTQEALIKAWLMLPSFRGESRLTTWLYRLVVNLGLNRIARLRREAHAQASPRDEENMVASGLEGDPQRALDDAELREQVRRQVDALPEMYRLPIVLYYQHDQSYQEIADILQLPINTVKTHLARARQILAGRLGSQGGRG
jgi:RNA polymerase sigma-70 factor, ECF subfamily